MSDIKQGKDKKVKAGDQSKKVSHKGKKVKQGDSCCQPSDFSEMVRPPLGKKDPSYKGKVPTEGPFDALVGKKAGKSKSMPKSDEKELKKVKK